MTAEGQRQLAEYKAQVDARYARMKGVTLEAAKTGGTAERPGSRAHWLLINPDGGIDGVLIRRESRSAVEAFEQFYPKKRERIAAAAEGWHIEQDDEQGTRFDAWRAELKQGQR